MKAYFMINAAHYPTNDHKVMTTLNKMSEGRGALFAEGWYYKINDVNIPAEEKTFDKLEEDFQQTFTPTGIKDDARRQLERLKQRTADTNGFSSYVSDFRLAAAKAGFAETNYTLIDYFIKGLNTRLIEMVLSMENPPADLPGWIKHASKFNSQLQRIRSIQSGSSFHSHSRPPHDPNAMDVDAIRLSPVERAHHMKENRCFICHKVGCSTRNHPRKNSDNPPTRPPRNPTRARATAVEPVAPPPPPSKRTKLGEYVDGLAARGVSRDEILRVLEISYSEEPTVEEGDTQISAVVLEHADKNQSDF